MYPIRSIDFVGELIYPPQQLSLEKLQQVHSKAFSERSMRYANFQVLPNGVTMSNPVNTAGGASNATILPDRVRIHEQNTGISQDDFEGRMHQMASLVLEELATDRFLAQQFQVRSLVNPRSGENSLGFLQNSVLTLDQDVFDSFGQTPDVMGLRMRLPAQSVDDGAFQIRVENYERDQRSLFLENVGLFRTAVMEDNLEELGRRFRQTYDTLQGPVLEFVERFDGNEP